MNNRRHVRMYWVKLHFIVLFLFPGFQLQAQYLTEKFEPIPIRKVHQGKLIYRFKDPVIRTIRIESENRIQSISNKEGGQDGLGSKSFLEAFFGTSPSSVEVICNPVGMIVCDQKDLSWVGPYTVRALCKQ